MFHEGIPAKPVAGSIDEFSAWASGARHNLLLKMIMSTRRHTWERENLYGRLVGYLREK